MSIQIVGHDKCCGCRTCVLVCPVDAISIQTDKRGFEFPSISQNKCINCSKCERVCPVLNVIQSVTPHVKCGAAYSLNEETKFNGSSGGLFGTFAQYIIKSGGVVFGAAFDPKFKLRTSKAETIDELFPLYKSKYLLCDTNDSFKQIQDLLKEGRLVLYCSSPCQIAALKLYLRKDYENLYTIDFVCHGVGSQRLFDQSIDYIERKRHIKIKEITLRYKTPKAVSSHYYSMKYIKKQESYQRVDLHASFPYYYAYGKKLLYRENCYDCLYATGNRVGDITIGDFHTIQNYNPNIDRFSGVSMFLCNSPRGLDLLKKVSNSLYVEDYEWNVLKGNNRFGEEQEKKPLNYNEFLETVSNSFDKAVSKYLNPYKDIRFYYYKLPFFVRKFAKKILKF